MGKHESRWRLRRLRPPVTVTRPFKIFRQAQRDRPGGPGLPLAALARSVGSTATRSQSLSKMLR
jgi:hypothetical protein